MSYYEDHACSLPKGKVGKLLEFGDKLRVDMSRNGYVTNFKVYSLLDPGGILFPTEGGKPFTIYMAVATSDVMHPACCEKNSDSSGNCGS